MESFSFDDLENSGANETDKAFFEINHSNEAEVLTWLNTELGRLKNEQWQNLTNVKNNYLRYKGYQYASQVHVPRDVLETAKTWNPQIVVPWIRDAVEEKVSRLLDSKPIVFPMPQHDETRDKNDAQVAKKFLSHIDQTKGMQGIFRKFVRNKLVGGEAFLLITWDPDLGEPLPAVKKMMANPSPDDDGGYNQTGSKPAFEAGVMQGDVSVKNKTQFYVFRPNKEWAETDYCFIIEWVETAKLKAEYPGKAGNITSQSKEPLFDFNTLTEKTITNQCQKITFYHKKTKFMPEGYEACFVKSAILKGGKLSYDHGEIPLVILMDQENPDEHRGQSFINTVRAMASQMNNYINAAVKSMMLAGHAKWFVESGSVDEQQLNNDVSIVRVKQGASKPLLAQANPVSSQLPQWLDWFKENFYQMCKSNSISRGDLPPGVTANVALQFVSESENRRGASEVEQVHEAIRKSYDLILKTCGQFYRPDDERTMLIMGPDGKFSLEDYSVEAIAKPYHLVLQSVSGLPESKALRTQFIIDMANAYPGMFPQEQVVEMLGFGQTEKFMSLASAAARAAEDENEMMISKGQMVEPAEHEDHITHWRVHTMAIQATGFKLKTDPMMQQMMKDHIMATEMMMVDQAKQSPQFLAKIVQLPQFPMFYRDPASAMMLGMVTGMTQQSQAMAPQPMPNPAGEQAPVIDESAAM